MAKARVSVILSLALAACGPADNDPGPGGVSTEDARALDEAAAKLDTKPENQSDKAPSQ
jgi:hypothetical protein